MNPFILSVFELNTYVSDKLYFDPFLSEIWVQGEVGDLSIKNETAFFVLADGQASVECILFDFDDAKHAKTLEEGNAILVQGNVSIYRKNGSFRIVVESLYPAGLGEIYAEFHLLKEKLKSKGVFDREYKQKKPPFPKRVGIVTSKDGAAIHDIIQVAKRRNPSVQLVLYPAKVQGAGASAEIVQGIQYFNEKMDVDVLIVGRGGGAAEDLFAFNDETVVMEIFHSNIPVISAIGHESDYTLSDLAADLRAPTPSAAAELAVPVKDDVLVRLRTMRKELRARLSQMIQSTRYQLEYEQKKVSRSALLLQVHTARQKVTYGMQDITTSVRDLYHNIILRYNTANMILAGANPEVIFKRGYSIVEKDHKTIRSISALLKGDQIEVQFLDGRICAKIMDIQKRSDDD